MPSTMSPPDSSTLLRMYEVMTTIRQCGSKARSIVMSGQAALICYSSQGEEAIAAGVGAVLRADDYVVTTYRGMGDHIAKGVPMEGIWAEYLGRASGVCKGKGGPMHLAHPESGLVISTGIVGSGLPIANGIALSSQLRGQDQVTVCHFGDGASNIGAFHEALNMAQLWKLPVIFMCHNNQWAEHTQRTDHQCVERIADRADSYGMAKEQIDGRNPAAVWAATTRAVERARQGDGPTLIEAVAERLAGHFIGDGMTYQPPGWLDEAMTRDPLPRFRAQLIADGVATDDELASLDDHARQQIEAAVAAALAAPQPELDELHRDIYAEVPAA